MKSRFIILLIIIAAVLGIIDICVPLYAGNAGTSPNEFTYTFYLIGSYYAKELSTGISSFGLNENWAIMNAGSVFGILVGVTYNLVTLAPKLKVGKLNILAGILILFGSIVPLFLLGDLGDAEIYVEPLSHSESISTFASVQPIGLILGIIAGILAICSGIMVILQRRKAQREGEKK